MVDAEQIAPPTLAATRALTRGALPGLLATMLVLVVACLIWAPSVVQPSSLLTLAPVWAVLALVSIGQMLVIQQRGIDLSVPGNVALAAALVTNLSDGSDEMLPLAAVCALAAGTAMGCIIGLAVTWLKITPIIVSLAANALALGAFFTVTAGRNTAAPDALADFAVARTLGIPNLLLVLAIPIAAVFVYLRFTVGGRWFVATGASPRATKVSGIPTSRYIFGAYVAAGFCFALAGVALVGYLRTPGVGIGNTYLFSSVAAVVVGGTSLSGGKGSVIGTVVAAAFLTLLVQFLYAIGAPSSMQLIVQALAIAIAAALVSFQLKIKK
ncbi:ABC transporter permease [Microbacterium rhizomatis]|uniref:ABC transporter permease n=1 Tax=Microbacterium rhizomatis TaxID=1631477 RepID=UPI0014781022|nr:ABC transporter permease [Microbacterium rhizomatis]